MVLTCPRDALPGEAAEVLPVIEVAVHQDPLRTVAGQHVEVGEVIGVGPRR